eukprot:1212638-Rhodomonas_salina.3
MSMRSRHAARLAREQHAQRFAGRTELRGDGLEGIAALHDVETPDLPRTLLMSQRRDGGWERGETGGKKREFGGKKGGLEGNGRVLSSTLSAHSDSQSLSKICHATGGQAEEEEEEDEEDEEEEGRRERGEDAEEEGSRERGGSVEAKEGVSS